MKCRKRQAVCAIIPFFILACVCKIFFEGTQYCTIKSSDHTRLFNKQNKTGYMFDCSNINDIELGYQIGHGVTKQVYPGYYKNQMVAVKIITEQSEDYKKCIKQLLPEETQEHLRARCAVFPQMKLMKEVLLSAQINHPNIVPLLGFCVRNENIMGTSLPNHGIITVYEHAKLISISGLKKQPDLKRIQTAVELMDLMDYLQNSPMGSLMIADFKMKQFLLSDGRILLSDLDDVTSEEPKCNAGKCMYNLPCNKDICTGANALHNLKNTCDLFFTHLLNTKWDAVLDNEISISHTKALTKYITTIQTFDASRGNLNEIPTALSLKHILRLILQDLNNKSSKSEKIA